MAARIVSANAALSSWEQMPQDMDVKAFTVSSFKLLALEKYKVT